MRSKLIVSAGVSPERRAEIEGEWEQHTLPGFSLIVSRTMVLVVPDHESGVQSYDPGEGVVAPGGVT